MAPRHPTAATLVASATLIAACGARTGLLADDGAEFQAGSSEAGPDVAGEPTARCVGPDIPVDLNAPNLYFVLDHSGSMNLGGKWDAVRQAVANIISGLGDTARFGATIFPAPGQDGCTTGTEVMSLRAGDPSGATSAAFLSVTTAMPSGGTPTAATLDALRPTLAVYRGSTFVILATDGGPNCNDELTCGIDRCTNNIDTAPDCPMGTLTNCCDTTADIAAGSGCLDDTRSTQAVANLAAAGIRTFVIGIPGSGPYATVLEELAAAGGTARPSSPGYYRVDSTDTMALSSALEAITAQTGAGCMFTLASAPQPAIRVDVGGVPVSADGPDGWTLDGNALTLHGASCQVARTQGASAVRVVRCGG